LSIEDLNISDAVNGPIADAYGAPESVLCFGPMKSRLFLRVVVALSLLHFAVVLDAQPRELPRRTVLGAAVADKDGVEITSVTVGGAAERAGLRADDLVTAIGDDTVANSTEFVSLVKRQVTDHPVLFHIRRGDSALALPVMLDNPPNELDSAVTTSYETVTVQGTLRRTLVTVPKGPARPRAAVLILSGIGCFSVDNAAAPQDAYMRLAHDLSKLFSSNSSFAVVPFLGGLLEFSTCKVRKLADLVYHSVLTQTGAGRLYRSMTLECLQL
jgi:PDZ domain